MDAMDDWKTITKPNSVAPLLALPSQAENDLCSMGLFLGGQDKIYFAHRSTFFKRCSDYPDNLVQPNQKTSSQFQKKQSATKT